MQSGTANALAPGSLDQPLKKKRGRPTKAEMEAKKERARLLEEAQRKLHEGGGPAETEDLQHRQQLEQEMGQQNMELEHEVHEHEHEQEEQMGAETEHGQGAQEADDDDSDEDAPESPDDE